MPDLREVFRAATQEVHPDQGFLERQQSHQLRRARNRRFGTLVLVAALVLVTAVFAIRLAGGNLSQPAVRPTPWIDVKPGVYRVDVATGDLLRIAKVPSSPADASPDGSAIAFGGFASGGRQIFVASPDGSQVRRITRDPYEVIDADWSPDGGKLAVVAFGRNGTDRSISIVDLDTGRMRQLTHESADASNPAWSPDGTQILYTVGETSQDSVLRLVDLATGKATQLTEPGEAAADGSWSPDGSTIAFALDVVGGGPDDSQGIVLMNADGTGWRVLVRDVRAWGPVWSPDGTRIAYFADYSGFCCDTLVFDLATGESRAVADGGRFPTWLDDDTLIVEIR
jgi:TolB protein